MIPGDPVTVVAWSDTRLVIRSATVVRPGGGNVCMEAEANTFPLPLPYSHDDEGRTWCRGHVGPEVDALRVALALR